MKTGGHDVSRLGSFRQESTHAFVAAAAWARGKAPKPSFLTPIPSLSTSEELAPAGAVVVTLLFFSSRAAASRAACASASSRSRSYPSWRIRSASAAARRSASAKSTGAAFFAPRPFFAGREAPVPVLVVDVLVEESVRTPAEAEAELARREEDVMVRGAAAVGVEGAPEAGADEARPIIGGAADCGGSTALDFDGAGLSQEEKKSSSSAAASD